MATVNDNAGGNDVSGSSGNDILNGNGGADTLRPGTGQDIVDGGSNSDLLVVDYSASSTPVIMDAPTPSAPVLGTFTPPGSWSLGSGGSGSQQFLFFNLNPQGEYSKIWWGFGSPQIATDGVVDAPGETLSLIQTSGPQLLYKGTSTISSVEYTGTVYTAAVVRMQSGQGSWIDGTTLGVAGAPSTLWSLTDREFQVTVDRYASETDGDYTTWEDAGSFYAHYTGAGGLVYHDIASAVFVWQDDGWDGHVSDGAGNQISYKDIERFDVSGGSAADQLGGAAGADLLHGNGGDDRLVGRGGNDQLYGDAGTDTAVFSGNLSDYKLTFLVGDSVQVQDLRPGSPDGTDTLHGVELLAFADQTLAAQHAPSLDLDTGSAGLDYATGYTEQGLAVSIGGAVAITDADAGDPVEKATVTLLDPLAGDSLAAGPLPPGVSLDPASTATSLILVGAASAADYAAAIASITFSSSSDDPTAGGHSARHVSVTVQDGSDTSTAATATITVNPVNDPPRFDESAHFDGSSWIDILGPQILTGTGAYSYNVVFRGSPNGAYQNLISTGLYTTNANVSLYLDPAGHIDYTINNAFLIGSSTIVADGKWHEVTATYDGAGHHLLYVDGVLAASYTGTGVNIASGPAVIGAATLLGGNPFTGDIAEVNIWNRALTAAEANAAGTPPASSPGLIGSYHFESALQPAANSAGPLPNGSVIGTLPLNAGTVFEIVGTSGSAVLDGTSGSILFSDPEASDTHQVTAVAGGSGYLGSFGVVLDEAAHEVRWTYSVQDRNIDFLAEGEQKVQTYQVTVADAALATDTATVTVILTGHNDAPVIGVGAGDRASLGLAEANSGLTGSGTVTVVDPDLTDTVTASVVGVTASGTTAGLVPGAASLKAMLSVTGGTIAADTGATGNLGWSFNSGSEAFDYLGQGETLTLTYTIRATDGRANADQTVTVTIAGTADAPVILSSSDSQGQVVELPDHAAGENTQTLGDSGIIAFSDADATDTHSASAQAQGNGYLGNFTLGAIDQAAHSLGWSFSVPDAALNSLAQGQVVRQYYDVTISDGHGGSVVETVEVDLVGRNDAASLSSDNIVVEQGATPVTAAGTLTITDEDNPAQFLAQASVAGRYGHFSIDAAGHWSYTADQVYSVAPDQFRTDVFTVLAIDGTPTTVAVTIGGHDAPAIARQDLFSTDEAHAIGAGLSLFADNGSGADSDPDGALSIAAVNGSAGAVGQLIGLPSGAVIRVNADGTFSYDPNHAFDSLTGASGAANTFAFDQFSYTLAGGATAVAIISITGVNSAQDVLLGGPGDDAIFGTPQPDTILVQQGGHDRVLAQASDDGIYFGASLDGADAVDGGEGNDTLALQGNTHVTLGDVTNVENLLLMSGSDATFGDTANNRYGYDLTTNDGNVAAGQTLTVIGTGLLPGENLHFDGSAETDGAFAIFAGQGVDSLTGGGGGDGFFFGADGNLTGADHVDGGAGIDTLALRGNYVGANAVVFTDSSMANIEVVALLSGHTNEYSGQIVPGGFDYDLTMADGNLAAGQRLDVIATGLGADESVRFDGRLETNGAYRILSGAGDDTLWGGAGNDTLYGGLGADRLEGGAGADTYVYHSAAESTSTHYDTITGFDWHNDVIDIPGGGSRAFTQAGSGALSTATFDANLAAGLSGVLGAGQAALFTATSGTLAGHVFAVIDANGVAGYQAGQDLVIDLAAPAAPIPAEGLVIG